MQSLDINRAKPEDLPRIMQIYEYARNFMKETGNESQWKNNYPPKDMIMDDIRNGNLYVIKKENEKIGRAHV